MACRCRLHCRRGVSRSERSRRVSDNHTSRGVGHINEPVNRRLCGSLGAGFCLEGINCQVREIHPGNVLASTSRTGGSPRRGIEARADLRNVTDTTPQGEPPAARGGCRRKLSVLNGDGSDGIVVTRAVTIRYRACATKLLAEPHELSIDRFGDIRRIVPVLDRARCERNIGLDTDALGEINGMHTGDEHVRRLLKNSPSNANGRFDAGHPAGGPDRSVAGHHARICAGNAIGLDTPSDTGVKSVVPLKHTQGGLDSVNRGRLGRAGRSSRLKNVCAGIRGLRVVTGAPMYEHLHDALSSLCPRHRPSGQAASSEKAGLFILTTEHQHNMTYDQIEVPDGGEPIVAEDGELSVPENPIIPILHGDGIGVDVGPAAEQVLGKAAEATGREIHWMRIYAGESARERYDENLPDETLEAIREFNVALKGPLTTPVGAGYRSLNVALRQRLDLYANVRPTYYLEGVPSPVKNPEEMDMITFRENTEDVYAGIEFKPGTPESERVREFIEEEMGYDGMIHEGDVGIGIKPITEFGSKRLIREAIDYAIENDRDSVTIVHKGNIMKYTEGAFRDWGYEVAEEEYGDEIITEDTLWEERDGEVPEDTIVVNDRIADNMLQQMLTRTDQYDVLAMPNLNGDYLTDSCGAQIGGLGIAPGANFGEERCLAEPVHGSAPKYAGQDKVNPTAIILSGRLMFDFMGWSDAGDLVRDAVEKTISEKKVTYDLHREIEGGEKLATSEYAAEVVKNIERLS